jgi:hypothetical protein
VVLCDDVIKYLQPAREGNWLKFSLKLTLPSRRGAHVVRPTNCPPTSALTDGDFLSLALVDIIIRSTVLFISFRGRMECVTMFIVSAYRSGGRRNGSTGGGKCDPCINIREAPIFVLLLRDQNQTHNRTARGGS